MVEWFKRILLFLKQHWEWFVLAIILLAGTLFLSSKSLQYQGLLKAMEQMTRRHEQELEELRKIQEDDRNKRLEIEQKYRDVLNKIEEQRQAGLIQLDKQKKDDIKRIITEVGDDPQKMASELQKLFGFPISL